MGKSGTLKTLGNWSIAAGIAWFLQLAPIYLWTFVLFLVGSVPLTSFKSLVKFVYFCFLQPLGKTDGQQSRLDRFYDGQAVIYDDTRSGLLKGRKKMLRLLAAEINVRQARLAGRVWVDVGGGTGWNIEKMHTYIPLENFSAIYLVDLCEPLLEVARRRLARFPNVHVVKADATVLPLDVDQVDFVTMSYSLSMIPPYFKVIDRVLEILRPEGIISVVDFFTSNKDDSGIRELNRQGNLFNRIFWRSWFEFDHVDLNPARRDYLEHKFELIKSVSCRNSFVVPLLVSIPYYIYLGQKPVTSLSVTDVSSLNASSVDCKLINHTTTMPPTPDATPLMPQKKHSMSDELPSLSMPEPYLKNITARSLQWSNHRLPYDPMNADQAQFSDFIYSFVWEDPDEDIRQMAMTSSDDMLVITSAGDNALDYLVNAGPNSIHCVDMNPCQGHLLELKIAAIKALSYADFWKLFGDGKHQGFPALLDRMAPFMSAPAYQFWTQRESSFENCFYECGYAGNVVKIMEWLLWITGSKQAGIDMSTAVTLQDQRKAWVKLRKTFISNTIGTLLLANPLFLWNALGVPINQLNMLKSEGSPLKYAIDTLDPVAEKTLLSKTNFHYLLPLIKHYTPECCPAYLKIGNFELLSKGNLLDALTLHTDTINNVLSEMPAQSLSKAIVMDHQDWFDPIVSGTPFPVAESYLDQEIQLFKKVLRRGGEVWWRSAAKAPWYADRWSLAGFEVKCISSRDGRDLLDAVNMYASLWRAKLPV
ncbi:Putative uncharacterized protein [Taphrina deformans PYCC 5710]|uniref:Methyltransferase domain-containing protein n=1 Tax=Taphrina deformans (strain PYCC 5710 / ATCC 11124 / CBS 356.35 / IMI 108563 / JCM 9778 / NBRC 8474) TaxID=1097556 RepID=R4X7V7_TAPDE|nr:Putative uncharacterized protein [Taphrina deformans PYCC 5710]|eukprot:CCG81536.1 Putative uncharacterized protein [Taphrina deformans PYCC 5710]